MVLLSHPYVTTGKTIALTRWTFVGREMSLLFNMLVLTIVSWPAYRFLKRQVRWSGIPISFRIFHSFSWSTVKGFGVVNKAEVDIFLELSCFFYDPMDLASWSLVPLPFLNTAWTSGLLGSCTVELSFTISQGALPLPSSFPTSSLGSSLIPCCCC